MRKLRRRCDVNAKKPKSTTTEEEDNAEEEHTQTSSESEVHEDLLWSDDDTTHKKTPMKVIKPLAKVKSPFFKPKEPVKRLIAVRKKTSSKITKGFSLFDEQEGDSETLKQMDQYLQKRQKQSKPIIANTQPTLLRYQTRNVPPRSTQPEPSRSDEIVSLSDTSAEGSPRSKTKFRSKQFKASTQAQHVSDGTTLQTLSSDNMWIYEQDDITLETLAVHPKKVAEVQDWLTGALKTFAPSLMVMSGNSGCGKSTTLRTVAKAMACRIVEWINPINTDTLLRRSESYERDDTGILLQSFETFMLSCQQYNTLEFESDSSESEQTYRNLILIEDLPFMSSKQGRARFQQILRNYLASTRASGPLVLTFSDIGNDIEDALSLYECIPVDIRQDEKCKVISFNPVAPTILRPVLRRLNERLLPSKRLSAAQIDVIIANANGDIRNAINTLQFSRLLATPEHLASSRDEPVDLFHMLGKLLYSKRSPFDNVEGQLQPFHRTKIRNKLEAEPAALLDDINMDPEMLQLYLHQNYTLFADDIANCYDSIQAMSDADMIFHHPSNGQAHECAELIAVQGLVYSRSMTHPKQKRVLQKPQWFRINSEARANLSLGSNMVVESLQDQRSSHSFRNWPSAPALFVEWYPYLAKINRKGRILSERLPSQVMTYLKQIQQFGAALPSAGMLIERSDWHVEDKDEEPLEKLKLTPMNALTLEEDIQDFSD